MGPSSENQKSKQSSPDLFDEEQDSTLAQLLRSTEPALGTLYKKPLNHQVPLLKKLVAKLGIANSQASWKASIKEWAGAAKRKLDTEEHGFVQQPMSFYLATAGYWAIVDKCHKYPDSKYGSIVLHAPDQSRALDVLHDLSGREELIAWEHPKANYFGRAAMNMHNWQAAEGHEEESDEDSYSA